MNENVKFCQSCAMPMDGTDAQYGVNADGTENEDYCSYCFKDGVFTSELNMGEMIDFCVPYLVSDDSGLSAEQAREILKKQLPLLKRWQNQVV